MVPAGHLIIFNVTVTNVTVTLVEVARVLSKIAPSGVSFDKRVSVALRDSTTT